MISGIGTDIVEVGRIRESVRRLGDRFLNRIFTANERRYFERKMDAAPHIAARFAAKEALVKALGTGLTKGIEWKQIEVLNQKNGKPYIVLNGKIVEFFRKSKSKHIHLSLSHTRDLATAQVVLES